MNHEKTIRTQRQRRRWRVRNRIKADSTRPRLSIFRSHKHMYAQVIDDDQGHDPVRRQHGRQGLGRGAEIRRQQAAAQAVGKAIAERALAAGIKDVAFDRRDYQYHGRVAALAERPAKRTRTSNIIET